MGFSSTAHLKSWLRSYPGRAAVGVVFGSSSSEEDGQPEAAPAWHNVSYELWYNRSTLVDGWYAAAGHDALRAQSGVAGVGPYESVDSSVLLAAQHMIDDATLGVLAEHTGRPAASAGLDVTLSMYPRLQPGGERLSAAFGSLFITIGLSLPMLATVVRLVSEKEHGVTGAMRSIGVAPAAYWLSYWGQSVGFACAASVLVYLGGLACQLPLFRATDGGILLCVALVYLLNMTSVGFLLSSLTHQVRIATILAVCVLIAAAAVAVLARAPTTNPTAFLFWEPAFPPGLASCLFLLLPPVNMVKILSDVAIATAEEIVFNATTPEAAIAPTTASGPFFDWEAMGAFTHNRSVAALASGVAPGEVVFATPPPAEALGLMCLSTALCFVLAWYFDQVLVVGAKPLPPHFLLLPSYWAPHLLSRQSGAHLSACRGQLQGKLRQLKAARDEGGDGGGDGGRGGGAAAVATVDTDVTAEMAEIGSADGASGASVELVDLRRKFSSIAFRRSKGRLAFIHRFVRQKLAAVKGVSLSFRSGNVFALLGHNGAGKTTTLSMLTGLTSPSSGQAFLCGESVADDLDGVRTALGVCPQFDCLWDDLTALEHMRLFSTIKGLAASRVEAEGRRCLAQVKLDHVAHQRPGTFSGGMRRRLSLAIATIGDPKVLFLDEVRGGDCRGDCRGGGKGLPG